MKAVLLIRVTFVLILSYSFVFAQSYLPLTILGTNTTAGASLNQFDNPTSVFVSNDGYVFVADKNNNRVSVWTQSGSLYSTLTSFGSFGTGPAEFINPTSVFKASNGYIYVTDGSNSRISVWTQSGNTFGNLTTFGDGLSLNNPLTTKVASDGNIYITDYYNNRISVWTLSGGVFGNLTTFGTNGSAINELNQPTDIAFASDGKILVADAANDRISVWTNTGSSFTALTTFGGTGSASNQLSSPWAITVATDNKIYIADISNQRLSVWSTSGLAFGNVTTLGTTGTSGAANNQFSDPSGVFITNNNTLYVADLFNHRISVWEACSAPQITKPPTSQTICGSNTASFSVTATGTGLTYSWWDYFNGSQSVSTTVGFQTSVAGLYFVLVSGTCGTANSNVFTVMSNPATSITNQPTNQVICGGVPAFLGVTATGANLSYLWSNGATTPSIQTTVVGAYSVTVTGLCGNAVSNTANISNGGTSTQITTQPISQTVCSGSTATLSVVGTGSGLSYLWSNGNTTSTIQTSIAGSYMVTLTGSCGKATSSAAQVTLQVGPAITGISTGLALAPGQTTNLNVTATGTNLAYLWNTGATTAALNGVGTGEYIVTVSGTCGSVVSRSVLVGNIVLAATNSGYTHKTNLSSVTYQLNYPGAMSFGSDGRIYIVEPEKHYISVWTNSGNTFSLVTTFGGFGSANNQFSTPTDVHVGSDGYIYVSDLHNNRISVWAKSGNTYTPFTTFGSQGNAINQFYQPIGVSTSTDGKIFIGDHQNGRVCVWTKSGNTYTPYTTFGGKGNASDQFRSPRSIAFGEDGKVFVTDYFNDRISVWTPNGNTYSHFTTFGSRGSGANQFNTILRITISNDKKIYIADGGNNRISVWTQSGNNFGNLTTFGSYGAETNSFIGPIDLSIKNNEIYVLDEGNNRISVWKTPALIFYWQATFDVTAPTTFTGSTATLTWPTVPGLANVKYCIRISKDKTLGSGVKTICGLTGNSYTYNPNDPNARTEAGLEDYFWQVAAQDSAGNLSQWSETQTFSLDATATSITSVEKTMQLSIYPNPNNGSMVLESSIEGEVSITNALGIMVYSGNVLNGHNTLSLSLAKGVYLVKVGTIVKRLLIE